MLETYLLILIGSGLAWWGGLMMMNDQHPLGGLLMFWAGAATAFISAVWPSI